LPIGGKVGQKLINKLAKTGSPNYKLLKELTSQGAVLQETEDPVLLKQEYQLTKKLVAKKSLLRALFSFFNYKFKKGRLLKARDSYIVRQINQKLEEGETGVCFLGAYHQVLPKLAKDIQIILLKDPDKIEEYFRDLSKKRKSETFKVLARYLSSPINQSLTIRIL